MSVASYTNLRAKLAAKNRGRKNEVCVNKRPEIWAKMFGEDIGFWAWGSRVGTLHPDNSLTIKVNGWHTPSSVKVIEALSGRHAFTRCGRIWIGNSPMQDDTARFDSDRDYVVPDNVAKFRSDVLLRQQAVTLADMSAPDRMRLEMRVWEPQPCLSAKVKDYLRGNLPKDMLSGRDIYTLCDHTQNTVFKMMEDLL